MIKTHVSSNHGKPYTADEIKTLYDVAKAHFDKKSSVGDAIAAIAQVIPGRKNSALLNKLCRMGLLINMKINEQWQKIWPETLPEFSSIKVNHIPEGAPGSYYSETDIAFMIQTAQDYCKRQQTPASIIPVVHQRFPERTESAVAAKLCKLGYLKRIANDTHITWQWGFKLHTLTHASEKHANTSQDTVFEPQAPVSEEYLIPAELEAPEIDTSYYTTAYNHQETQGNISDDQVENNVDVEHPFHQMFLKAGLKIRSSQIQMIEVVKRAILEDEIHVIEAPTATGKSYAYLLGALSANTELKQPLSIVVSTATVALQEQLIHKDLPALEKLWGKDIDYRLAKGRGRYVCHRRLLPAEGYLPEYGETIQTLITKLDQGWSGDKDSLDEEVDAKLWPEICNTSATCSNKRCEFYQKCAFHTARKGLRNADIIVVNHSLLLSHLSLGDGAILPEFKRTVFMIDECHHLPAKALSSFAGQSTLLASHSWINDLNKVINDVPAKVVTLHNRTQMKQSVKTLIESLTALQKMLHPLYPAASTHEFIMKNIPDDMLPTINNVIHETKNACTHLLEIKKKLQDEIEENLIITGKNLEKHLSQLAFLLDRCEKMHHVWQLWIKDSDMPIAKWIVPYSAKSSSNHVDTPQQALLLKEQETTYQDYSVHASPVIASELLKQYFWDAIQHGVILCSATIRSLGNFDYYCAEMGLDEMAKTIHLPSPLPYQHSLLNIPQLQHSPQQSTEHIAETAQYIESIIHDLRTGGLCIFTSAYAMREVYQKISASVQKFILMQNTQSKAAMLQQHMHLIDQGHKSMLFGLQSFSEGIDLPGNYLTTLIIHKLPFSVPTDPIQKTKSEWMEQQGKKPFMELSLPEASVKLTQMCGRLVRREEDKGEVIVLDTRLKDKFYGKHMVDNLPNFRRH